MGKRKRIWHRLAAMLLAGMMCMTMLPVSAFADGAESVPTALETAAVDSSAPPTESESASSGDSAPLAESDPAAESSAGVSPATPESGSVQEPEEPPLSEAAQNFVAAVEALDRENILAAINDWAQASQAWQVEKENPELAAALEAATVSSDEAAAPVYAAEDLYNMLSDDERDDSAVQAAYAALASLIVAMQTATENPQPPEDTDAPPDLAEIAQVLYGDLPDAPTGSYMGSYGLPVATGETKIGIGVWHDELLSAENAGHLDAKTLNTDSVTISIPRKAGEKYAVVALNAQVEYPANGSTSEIVLPEDVVLLAYDETPASREDAEKILKATYTETSAATTGIYVRAENDFTAILRYCAPDGTALEKNVNVHLSDAVAVWAETTGASTYEARPTPSVTTGRITAVRKVNGSWLIWFNGEPAYCCTHGAQGQPNGCPLYTYAYTSIVTADQYTPGDHYGNQVGIWGGLGQLSLGLMSADAAPDAAYDDIQRWVMEHYPDSVAAKAYLSAMEQIADGATTFAADSDYYVYIYQPGISGWQTVATPGPPTGGKDPDIPPATPEYYASWAAAPQTASGSFDGKYTVNVDKVQLETAEKVDGAVIEIEPLEKGGSVDGGSWTITPADKQTVTTSGHTMDDSYQHNGGDASASWSLHYEVTKTSTTSLSGSEGPFDSQAEADTAAASAKASAEAQLQAEAQGMVDAAIAAAKAQLAILNFRYDESVVPYGFVLYDGAQGGKQTIAVPMDSANDYLMRNDEWSLKVNLKKVDSETGEQIAGDALYEVYEWDTVTQQYIPYGGYNGYRVERNPDGTYSVVNDAEYGTEFDTSRTMYYTQRNEGRFIIVETKAPDGYYGDWTDVEHPGTAGTPLGKRGYYIEITAANDGSTITLDNSLYSADIATSYTGGTKLLTSGGVETTVTIYKASDEPAAEVQYQDAGRVYNTDNSGTAANEDSYTMTPVEGVMQNDRTIGEISLSKVDLDAVRYVGGRDTDGDALASGQAHADARLDGAVYDLYAAEDIQHPDGVTGTVDYSKITYPDGTPIWHTTIRDNAGVWHDDYLPVLAKNHLVASATIQDGWLTFSNLYLGKYYIVERGTGVVIPVDGDAFKLSGTYPDIDAKTKEPTGTTSPLATNGDGQYTDYVYKNQWSYIGQSKALDSSKTYDGYYESYAKGYLVDEHNYYIAPAYSDEGWYIEKTAFEDNRQAEGEQRDTTDYSDNYHIHRDNALAESQDQVMKGNVELSKHVSSTGSSSGLDLEGAGFTFYLISDLSKEAEFATTRSGQYVLDSILDAYIDREYDDAHLKYDFSGEAQAIAKTYEVDAGQIVAYNESLTEAGDYRNGKGDGWVATGRPAEYQLAEIFSNDSGNIRVQGLPYGQYLVVETSVPRDVLQAEPFIVTVDPASETCPQSNMANPKGAAQIPSGSYQKYTVLDEEMEVYLRITKKDEETGKAVLLPDTTFQIYWMDDAGRHILDAEGKAKLVTMTDTTNGHLTKDVDTFYTDANGVLTLPERLPLGHFRIVEVQGPAGFYNKWLDSAVYEDAHLKVDDAGAFADGVYFVDFDVTTDRIYQATGDDSENSQDILVIDESYSNRETLGKLTIRKTGEVLTGWEEKATDLLDPQFGGEAVPGDFVYTERPIPYAEFTITANENIYTADHQTDANGNRLMWYAKGDVVAVVRTGDGTSDIAAFAPGRTNSTYDFLSVIHDGTVGEVSVTLPLGSYHVEETAPPYGFTGTAQSYDVTFAWDEQTQSVVMAQSITRTDEAGNTFTDTFDIVNSGEAAAELAEDQVLKFRNGRQKAKIIVTKRDAKTDELLPGAVFNLYTRDDIYSADGELLFRAGDLLATSAPTGEDGAVVFDCDIPVQGQNYGKDSNGLPEIGIARNASKNSGRYYVQELRPPEGYFLNSDPMQLVFTYTGEVISTVEQTCRNKATTVLISKRELTGDDELPGATLTIQDEDGNVVRQWVSGDEPAEIRGLHMNEVYKLVETVSPDGYAIAESIRFMLVQRTDSDGDLLDANDVYVCTGKDLFIFDRWEKMEDGTVVMRDDITRVEISKQDITTKQELPGARLTLKDADGNVIESWISSDKPHLIEKLPAGWYELFEEQAPDGYRIAESIKFEVQPTGKIQAVVMYDERQPDTPTPTPTPTPPIPTPSSPPVPQTGDLPWLPVALAAGALAALGGLFVLHRRKKHPDGADGEE